jgi:hypothetical protein
MPLKYSGIKHHNRFKQRYGLEWSTTVNDLAIEIDMIKFGGVYTHKDGHQTGNGIFFHYKRFCEICWPHIKWHKWNERILQCWLKYRIIGCLGPANSGKTNTFAILALVDYYCFPSTTTVLLSSTTKESLEMRIWGEVKKLHRMAKRNFAWLPGNLIEGRQRIITDHRQEASEGRDFRNGLCGVACKKGQNYQGMGDYIGIKNDRVRLIGDELQFMPRAYVDAIANLNKNRDFKCGGMGNPKETTDALGIICEPASELGGWDGGIDQSPGTKDWPSRFDQGCAIQLPGSDSPNADGNLGIPIITQADIDADIKFYGKDSLQFTMMDEGRMPKGASSHRVLTRQLCLKFHALEEALWKGDPLTKVAFLDAAYGGVGGDRCIFGQLEFGQSNTNEQIINLVDTVLVPVNAELAEPPEDQIAYFVKQQCESRGISPENFGFDSTGRGTLMSAFARLWSNLVVPIEFGGTATDRQVSADLDVLCKDYYFKFVSELWYSMRLTVEAGQFRGMTEDVMQEFCIREWGFTAGNKIEVEPKDKMKLKTGRSPDLADAVVAGLEMARRRGFRIKKLKAFARLKVDRKWRTELQERQQKLWHGKSLSYSH